MKKKFSLLVTTIIIFIIVVSGSVLAENQEDTVKNIKKPIQVEVTQENIEVDPEQVKNKFTDNNSPIQKTNSNITTMSEDITVLEDQRVYGNVTTVSGDINIFGEVFGNLTTATGNIHLYETAKVRGNIAAGTGEIVREPGAEIQGNILRGSEFSDDHSKYDNNFESNGYREPYGYRESKFERTFNSFTTMLGLLAIIAIVMSIFPLNLQKMLNAFDIEPGRVILIGALGWILLPFVMIISVITIVGPVILGLGAFLSAIIGAAIVSLLLGEKIKELFKWQIDNKILTAGIGLIVLWLASLLPIASFFIVVICGVIGMGVVLVTKFGTGRPWFPPKKAYVSQEVEDVYPINYKDNNVDNKGGNQNEPPQGE